MLTIDFCVLQAKPVTKLSRITASVNAKAYRLVFPNLLQEERSQRYAAQTLQQKIDNIEYQKHWPRRIVPLIRLAWRREGVFIF